MRRHFLAGLALAVGGALGSGAAVSAGGWAVTTLDEVPVPVPGEEVDVGFTIRQHGVTPVDLEEGVGIEITASDGSERFFAAESDGVVGHYVATVVFPDAGSYTWAVRQGWFADQELGTIDVGASTAGGGSDWRTVVTYTVPGLALVLAAVAVADALVDRRRRRTALA